MTIGPVIAKYDALLQEIQQRLTFHHQHEWARALQSWREDLGSIRDPLALKDHAARSARALGGMESLGEIATGMNDKDLLDLVNELYSTTQKILLT